MSAIQPFAFEGHEVRIQVDEAGEPWFCAADVCECLGLDNARQAVAPLEEDEKGVRTADTPGGRQQMQHVTEAGLYQLVMVSRRPEAKAFRRWITHEVLPAVRKTGSYGTPSAALNLRDPAALQRLALELTGLVQDQQKALTAAAPKVEAWDSLMDAEGLVCLQGLARAIGEPPNLFIAWLREKRHIFSRDRSTYGSAEHVDADRFRHKVRVVDGREYTQVMATPRAIVYFGERRPHLQTKTPRRAPLPRPAGNPMPLGDHR